MEIIDSKSCAKTFLNKITFVEGSESAVIEIEDKKIHVDISNLAFFAAMGIKSFNFDASNCMLIGERADGTTTDLSAVIVSSVAGVPPVTFFKRLVEAAPLSFHYYCRVVIKAPDHYNLTKASLACSHFHAFNSDSYAKEHLNPEYVAIAKSGNIAAMVGLMRRRVSNPGFVNGFVDFTANEQATVRISAPILGGPSNGGYVKIDMLFNTLLRGTENCKEPIYFLYNGETNTLLCRNVKMKELEAGKSNVKYVPWVRLAYDNAEFVNNAVVANNDLMLDMCDESNIVSSVAIEGFSPVNFVHPPVRKPQTKKEPVQQDPTEPVVVKAKPAKAKKAAKAPLDKDAVINAAKAVIFNDAIPAENAIVILRNFNW